LFEFGLELMGAADGPSGGTPLQRAILYRDGLLIALMAARSLRRHNFSAIEIGRHLVKRGAGYWLCFEANETKTHEPIEVPVPDELIAPLEHYLTVYRRLLARRTGR
jgi:integrase/recombinase XerD